MPEIAMPGGAGAAIRLEAAVVLVRNAVNSPDG